VVGARSSTRRTAASWYHDETLQTLARDYDVHTTAGQKQLSDAPARLAERESRIGLMISGLRRLVIGASSA